MEEKKCIVKVQNLRKVYIMAKEKVVALNKINLEINKGEVCCILGTSGSGKSTLLNMMAGLEKPSKGSVHIVGNNISTMSEKKLAILRQKYIGFIFQSYNLLQSLTAVENVALPLMFKGIGRGKCNRAAKKMLQAVGLTGRTKHKPSEMSGGQQQRVGIARAFVARPNVVFADEPTGNLDSKTTVEVMNIMIDMARKYKQTLIIVTHDRSIANYADRVITLIDGDIVSDKYCENNNISEFSDSSESKTMLQNNLNEEHSLNKEKNSSIEESNKIEEKEHIKTPQTSQEILDLLRNLDEEQGQ